jgi:hypothetical protein
MPDLPRRRFLSSPPAVLAVLTAALMVAFVWWRLSVQHARVEQYWGAVLVSGAQLNRSRAEEWINGQRQAAELMGKLASRGRGRGSAFEIAVGDALASGDVAFVSIRDGNATVRCDAVPLDGNCVEGSPQYFIPSPDHPQARRRRPADDGRMLVPAAATIPAHDGSPGGVITLWLDPEKTLIPRLIGSVRSATGSRSVFVSRTGDSATVIGADSAGQRMTRRRLADAELPEFIGKAGPDADWVSSTSEQSEPAIIAHAYIPALGWDAYRVMSYNSAAAPFRRGVVTEATMAFILGSFVIGLAMWVARERREQGMRSELMQVRLESLQAQLRPHFLFNALNTIATLIHEDPDKADAMLIRLADLLRLSLEHSDEAEIPLRRELELFDAYIAIERVRFGSSLKVTRQVDPAALDLPVMRWLLQPLAENAIKHGAGYTRGDSRMDLRVTRNAGIIEITLGDDGPNPVGPSPAEGVGLRNTRQRLATLYGGAATLELRKRASGGTEAVLRIPETTTVLERIVSGEHLIPAPGLAR